MVELESTFIIRPFQEKDRQQVVQLWQQCDLLVSWNDPVTDISKKMQYQPELFLVGELNTKLFASIMIGYEGHRGWINYLAVSPPFQKKGYGKLLVDKAEEILREMGCLKINLQVREHNSSVIRFYQKLGYKDDHVISLGKRLE